MLGREERDELEILVRGYEVDVEITVAVDRAVVHEERDPLAAKALRDVGEEDFDPWSDRSTLRGARRRRARGL
jgi:hypothetical protein